MILKDSNRYYLQGTNQRFMHLATLHHGLREYMCFTDKETNKVYIDEITGGSLAFIQDDKLAQALTDYLTYLGILDINKPTVIDNEWLRKPKKI